MRAGNTRILWPHLRRRWPTLAGAGIATVVVTAAELAAPWPLKLVIDRLFEGAQPPYDLSDGDLRFLAIVAGALVGIALVEALASFLSTFWLARAGELIIHDLRVDTYAHLQRLSLSYHDSRKKGDLVTRVTADVTDVGRLFSDSLGTIVSAVLLLGGMAAVTVVLDPLLAGVVFLAAPLLIVIAARAQRAVRRLSRRQRADEGEIASLATENLSAMRVVKAFGAEASENGRVVDRSARRRSTAIRAAGVEAGFAGIVDVVGAIGAALVIVVGVWRVSSGALTPGDLVVFAAYARRTYRPLRDIVKQSTKIARAMARAERVAEVLAADETLPESPRPRGSGRARGDVAFEDVTFGYDAASPVLNNFSLAISAGERVAVVGRSGEGKSTLCALAARFHDPQGGRVTIDGMDARELRVDWLREQVGILLQDTILFSGSIAANIAYGTEAGVAEVVAAAKAAGADDFITALPHGYDTEVGHGGSGLSGGQRQRLGIARVLLRDPAILLLDEPTSGLDAASEADVLDGLEILMQGRTTIIVTHSESLARSADRVVVVEDGRPVQCGAPADLLSQVGPFRSIGESHRRLASRRTPAPRDPAISGLRSLLDPEEMTPVLEHSLGNGRRVEGVRLFHARITPRDRAVVGYETLVDGVPRRAVAVASADAGARREANLAANVSRAAAINGRSPARTPLTFDDTVGALIQWLPLDLWIPACGNRPAELSIHLGRAGGGCEPESESYLPLERAVFRAGERTVTAFASPREYAWAVTSLRVLGDATRSATPRLRAELPHLLCVVEDEPAGERPATPEGGAVAAGATLRALHSRPVMDLPHVAPADVLSAVARARTEIAGCAPLLGPRLSNLIDALVNNPPPVARLVAAHGSCSVERLVQSGGGFALRGLHRAAVMSPAADLSYYAAAALNGYPGDAERARLILDGVTYGYGGRPEGLSWYLAAAILQRATAPFREQTPDWPARTQALIAAAEEFARP